MELSLGQTRLILAPRRAVTSISISRFPFQCSVSNSLSQLPAIPITDA